MLVADVFELKHVAISIAGLHITGNVDRSYSLLVGEILELLIVMLLNFGLHSMLKFCCYCKDQQ